MEDDLKMHLEALEKKVDAVFASAEKTRKYIFWTAMVTLVLFVLPLIASVFIIPSFINTYSQISTIQ